MEFVTTKRMPLKDTFESEAEVVKQKVRLQFDAVFQAQAAEQKLLCWIFVGFTDIQLYDRLKELHYGLGDERMDRIDMEEWTRTGYDTPHPMVSLSIDVCMLHLSSTNW